MSYVPAPDNRQPGLLSGSRAILALILGVTALVYAGTLQFGFTYDDTPQIVTNPRISSWSYLPKYFTEHVWAQISASGTYYRPLFLLWLRLNHALFGVQNPFPWHLTTVLLHLLAVTLVFRLLIKTFSLEVAGIATFVFALHPGHVESVAWISGCTEPLMTCALVGAILCWTNRRNSRGALWLAASWLLCLASLLIKETAVLLPVLIFVYSLFEDRESPRFDAYKRAVLNTLPFAVITVAELMVRARVLRGGVADEPHPAMQTLLTVPSAISFYIQHLFWPVKLSPFYGLELMQKFSAVVVIPAALVALCAVALLLVLAFRSRTLLIAVAWLVLPVLPALIGIRLFDSNDIVHDRYLYLSTIGLGLLLGLAISRLPAAGTEIFRLPRAQFACIALIAIAIAAGTALEIRPWSNNLALFLRGVDVAPNSTPAYSHLAFEVYKRGDAADAERLYKHAVALGPNDWPANFGLAMIEMRMSNWNEADRFFQRAIEISPSVSNGSYLLQARVRVEMQHYDAAEKSVREAIDNWPNIASQHLLLAQILTKQGRIEEARSEYQKELTLNPTSTEARMGLAEIGQ
ncbi:tetratricopeptide repeat protein [Candidatus Korobacter versatilis]|nr:tetratricopeptide repeat protein [Candidatus Koribacter versatilis]